MASCKMMVETDTSTVVYEYEWRIKNFLKHDNSIRGEEFLPLKSLPLKLVVELQPRLYRADGHLDYKLLLLKLSKEKIPETCKVEINVQISNGPNYGNKIAATPANCKSYNLDSTDSISLFSAYLQISSSNLYVNGTSVFVKTEYLSILCTFTFFGYNVTTVSNTKPTMQMPLERCRNICSGLKILYESKIHTDITFEIGENTLEAHRCILVAQSSVFKKMFDNDLAESKSNCIQIADYDIRAYDCFLKYLYCGDIEDASFDLVMDLFALADKYGVDSLLQDCREILTEGLTVDTVCKVIILSDLHSDQTLKKKSMQFINHHFSTIKEKAEWVKLIDDYPKLASEFFNFLSANFV